MKNEIIDKPEILVDRLNLFSNNFVFRGHSNASWKLENSIKRLLGKNYTNRVRDFEYFSLQEFKTKFDLYNFNNYKPTTLLKWFAIMQHYGVPTRMLDFTESPFIALYFCLENSNKMQPENMAIYAINYRKINKITLDQIKKLNPNFEYDYKDIEDNKDCIYERYIKSDKNSFLWVKEPAMLNKRVEKQRGTFLYTNDTSMGTYDEIFETDVYKDVEIYKLEFPSKNWDNYYSILNKMNINGKTIYGDLDGLSKYIKMFIQAYI